MLIEDTRHDGSDIFEVTDGDCNDLKLDHLVYWNVNSFSCLCCSKPYLLLRLLRHFHKWCCLSNLTIEAQMPGSSNLRFELLLIWALK